MMKLEFSNIRYCPVGAVAGIGASAHYLRFDRWGILLDAGLDPHNSGIQALPDFSILDGCPLNAILISHAHLDHIGSLPVALGNAPHARVYMTPATADLTEQMLFHYLQVQRKKNLADWVHYSPLYSESLLENIRFVFQSFQYEFPFPLHGSEESGLRFTFYDAGHILGSAGILIEWRGCRIFYTGNTRRSSQFILRGARYPAPVDLLITEATYGANEAAEKIRRPAEVKRFAGKLSERLQMGSIVLIPVFALGRTQEMLMLLHRLRFRNQIPAVPIYITGFGVRVNKVYDRLLHKIYPEYAHGALRTITFGRWDRRRRLKGPAVLLSTSGMMFPRSPSFEYAKDLAGNARNAIFFVGYAEPETPGGLFRGKNFEGLKEIFGLNEIECGVEVFHFSAHSNRQELLKMIRNMRPRRLIFVHGDLEALQWMEKSVRSILPDCQTLIPVHGQWYNF